MRKAIIILAGFLIGFMSVGCLAWGETYTVALGPSGITPYRTPPADKVFFGNLYSSMDFHNYIQQKKNWKVQHEGSFILEDGQTWIIISYEKPSPDMTTKCRWEWRQTTESGLTKFLNDGWKPTPLNYDEGKAMFPYLKTEYSKMIFWLKRKVCN